MLLWGLVEHKCSSRPFLIIKKKKKTLCTLGKALKLLQTGILHTQALFCGEEYENIFFIASIHSCNVLELCWKLETEQNVNRMHQHVVCWISNLNTKTNERSLLQDFVLSCSYGTRVSHTRSLHELCDESGHSQIVRESTRASPGCLFIFPQRKMLVWQAGKRVGHICYYWSKETSYLNGFQVRNSPTTWVLVHTGQKMILGHGGTFNQNIK